MKLRINVTEDHINNGVCSSIYDCAIALAVRDVFPMATVNGWRIISDRHYSGDFTIDLPKEVRYFVRAFDSLDIKEGKKSDHLKPFSFEIELTDNVLNTINIEEVKEILINHPTMQLI